MKKVRLVFLGLILLCACSTGGEVETDKTSENDETTGTTTYGFEQDQDGPEESKWLLPNSYQITIDDSFEMVSRYETGSSEEKMFFWHKPSASEFSFKPEKSPEKFEKKVPTIEIKPINKYHRYMYMHLTGSESQKSMEAVKKEVKENSEVYLEEVKERTVELLKGDPTIYTKEDYDIEPFTYMIESETEQGVLHYELIGEVESSYLRATLTIPVKKKEELLGNMLSSIRTITYKEEEFKDNAVLDEPTSLSYEPAENLKGDYPEVGYSFEVPEAATFRYSYPTYHAYRYTFDTRYKESIEKGNFSLNHSELIVRVEKLENARNREEELRTKGRFDFVTAQSDHAQSITYLHEEEDFDTGIFSTAVRVEFDGYEKYWFLREVDGHVYEVTFDITFEAPEYKELLDNYLNVVRTFELIGIEE
ncbi:hypothetical protein [Halobacillus hunanensis]|uniref:hypothetical protein n=1 Tax=Halobacillus hunanensis TaxID=578214 RepID=UPI0009A7D4F0|nr:hypothetical protein [Halobacillus hunanensis]